MSKRLRVSMEVIPGIYEIVNTMNNHRYVGSSKDIYGRWVQHQRKLRTNQHHCTYLQNAWKLYGESVFEFCILEKTENTPEVLFDREQYWCDYYINQNICLYNVSPIVVSPMHTITIEDLQQGRCKTSYEQFICICNLLKQTDMSFRDISEIVCCSINHVRAIYNKEYFVDITKDMVFKTRKYKGEDANNAKLTEAEVIEIANKMTREFYTADLAKEYGIATSTIDDIRHKRTWRDITKDMVFVQPTIPVNGRKPILQYNLEGKLIAEYESGYEASRVTGIGYKMISRVCNGDRPHTHGFIFKFKTKQND
jgi:group I intron endonuclease